MPPQKNRANNSDLCRLCAKHLEDGLENIKCDNCKRWCHIKCAKLTKPQMAALRSSGEVEWECGACAKTQDGSCDTLNIDHLSMEQQISYIAKKMSKMDSIERAVQFYSEQYTNLEKNVSDTNKELSNLKKGTDSLSAEIQVLKRAVKTLNDERVKNEIVIRKLQLNSQSVENVVGDIITSLHLDINQNNYICRVVKNNSDVHRNVVVFVKFNQFVDKNALMKAKKNLRSNSKYREVMIFDVMGAETLDIFNYAKNLQKHGFPFVYSSGGKVFVKASKEGGAVAIRDKDHIDDLMKKAVSTRSSGTP